MFDLPTILKPTATLHDRALEQAMHKGKPDLIPIANLMNPDTCPADLLMHLAWSLSVDVWDGAWSIGTQRDVIKQSLPIHLINGTLRAAKDALASAGYGDAEVIERYGWEVYDGSDTHDGSASYALPDHWAEYRIRLSRPITIEQAAQVREILETVAPARSHLKALDFTEALNIHNARITHDGQFTHGVA